MHYAMKLAALISLLAANPFLSDRQLQLAGKVSKPSNQMHRVTEWKVTPSFKFDTLCFLNALTGDPYYLTYYGDEYTRFERKLTPAARAAVANLKRKIKDENKNIISAFLCLYFSATDDLTINDMLVTLDHSQRLERNLKKTEYYSEGGWKLFESVRADLKTVLRFLKEIRFDVYWETTILPKLKQKIAVIETGLPNYNVIAEVESGLGFALASNRITVYMLYYSQPHGIKITGTRFLTDVAWPFRIVLRNAAHEMMHPPYDLAHDSELRQNIALLKTDAFLMNKVKNHNPSFGYNSFEGFIEEDCVQALEQWINERLKVEVEAHQRWTESDDGMHVFSVALYNVMKQEGFNQKREPFNRFLIRMIQTGKLAPGRIKTLNEAFYSTRSP